MKTQLIFLVLLMSVFSCGTNKPVSDAEKDKIKGEVKEVVNTFFKGCEEVNFDMALAPFYDSPDFTYINNGYAFSYKDCADVFKPVFSTMLNQKITIVDEKYSFPDNSIVLYSNHCKLLTNYMDGHAVLQDPTVMLFIFKKINDKWQIIYGVESYVEKSVPGESSKGLNQAELLMKFVGNWEIPTGKDSAQIVSIRSLQGKKGLSIYSKWTTKGKLLFEGTGFWAYNAEMNKIDISIMHSTGYIFHDFGEFTSPETMEFTDENKMAKTATKFKLEFISPNEIKGTTVENNKTSTAKWKRIK